MKVVTYLYMLGGAYKVGTSDNETMALVDAKRLGALEVFVLRGDVAPLVKEIGVKKVYNLVRIVKRYG